MPTYEYECTACGQHIEVFQRIAEDALTTCGVCGGPLRKVFHPVGIVFKGSGFYATDSRSAAKGSSTKKDSDSGTASPSPGGGSSSKGTPNEGSSSERPSGGVSEGGSSSTTGAPKEPSTS